MTYGVSSSPIMGLSPRVRGNQVPDHDHEDRRGSIPACAGEPDRRNHGCWRCRVYPRVCGGTDMRLAACFLMNGLSPRVRGEPMYLLR